MTESPLLHQRFLRGLALAPRRTAVRFGGRAHSYEELHEIALRWAGLLAARAQRPPGVVGVLAEKGTTAYAGILAGLYSGATVVPMDPNFPSPRTRWMLEDARVEVVLADGPGRAALAATGLDVPVLSPAETDGAAGALPEPSTVRRDSAYILFTSGSTGRPKGVRLTDANLAAYFRTFDARYAFAPEDVFSQTLGLNFDCSLVDMFGAWAAGAAVQVVSGPAFGDLPGFAAEHGLTVWFSTPSTIALVRRMGGLRPGALSGLRLSYFAGEALLCADAEHWQQATGGVVENLYGPTELTITVTGHRYSPRTRELAVNGLVPIGRVHDGHDFVLLGVAGRPAAEEGELCITGAQMSPGYLDPEQDRGRFVVLDGRTWYRTGDRVRLLPGGELAYLGRSDSQVQVHGLRVELSEVDQAVRELPGVTDAVTVPVQTGGTTELTVFYTGERTAPVVLARLLRERLPAAMVPRRLEHLAQFPLNVNRKVDRGRLAELAAGD